MLVLITRMSSLLQINLHFLSTLRLLKHLNQRILFRDLFLQVFDLLVLLGFRSFIDSWEFHQHSMALLQLFDRFFKLLDHSCFHFIQFLFFRQLFAEIVYRVFVFGLCDWKFGFILLILYRFFVFLFLEIVGKWGFSSQFLNLLSHRVSFFLQGVGLSLFFWELHLGILKHLVHHLYFIFFCFELTLHIHQLIFE